MKTKPNHPSTPIANLHGSPSTFSYVTQNEEMTIGLTKREHFAGLAMQGLLSIYDDNEMNPTVPNEANVKYMAALSVKAADALIAELNRTQE